ncbi:MAG: HD domain-containing protein [Planctomycetota bacterium]
MSSPSRSSVVMRDPVHGDIELTREEVRVIDTPQFQRLRGVKQLGTAYLVYPGATHTRFEHSIGVLHMTDRLLNAVNKNAERDPQRCRSVAPEERRILRLAALLHDVTHIPFGHNVEDQTGLLPRHDVPERFEMLLGDTEVGSVLADLDVREDVLGVLARRAGDHPPFWQQVLSDTIDSDLMDYLRRDAYYTGLELRYDMRVADYFRVDKNSEQMFVDCEKEGMLRDDIMSELMRMLEIRYHFSERVYYHHAKVAAGALLARMVEMALRSGALGASELQQSTDQSLLDRLAAVDLGEARQNERMARFSQRFARRQLRKRALVLPLYLNRDVQENLLETYFARSKPEARFTWETQMEARARRAFGRDLDVIMHCPARHMQLKEARTLVKLPGSGDRTLPLADFADDIPRLQDLQESYLRLWKLYVFTSATDREVRRGLQEMCLEALPKGCRNALRL